MAGLYAYPTLSSPGNPGSPIVAGLFTRSVLDHRESLGHSRNDTHSATTAVASRDECAPLYCSFHGFAACSWGFPRPAEVLTKVTAPSPQMHRAWRHTLSYHGPRLPHLVTSQSTAVTTTDPTCVGGQEILKSSVVLLTQPDFLGLCIIPYGHLVPHDRSSNCYVEVLPGISAFRRGCHAAFQKKYRGCPVTPELPIGFGRMQ